MFRLICKSLLYPRNGYRNVTPHNSSSMEVSLSLFRYFSIDAHNTHSFTVSYLTQTCGLSPESALSASKIVRFESPEQPDSVISCLQKYGFSKTHNSRMIKKFPNLLQCDPEKTISPKVEFFCSIGASTPELVRIFTVVNPKIFWRSLENQLVRTFNILIELFRSDNKVIELVKQNPNVLYNTPEACLIPNVNTLRDNGVPESNIFRLLHDHRLCIRTNPVKVKNIVEEVKEMGFDPKKAGFGEAVTILASMPKSRRDAKVEVYKRRGWSEKDITKAFKKFPKCISYSEDKITGAMDFYVNELGLDSSVLVNFPTLFAYSLKKRLIPRGALIQYLSSKGLVKLDSSTATMFICTERRFLEKYVKCHEDSPQLIMLYNQKLNLSDMAKSGKYQI